MLEVITKGETSPQHPHALMLVHGAWHGAWCWEGNLLDHFAERGFQVVAPSLRGHGASATSKRVRTCSIGDYLTDIVGVAEELPTPPVMIGHSMGGFLVQKYLERRPAPAAVLLASTPPRGHLRLLMRLMRRHPLRSSRFALTGRPEHLSGPTASARELFFHRNTPYSVVDAVAERLRPDSARAIFFDMAVGDLVDSSRIATPTLVIGGEHDPICGAAEVAQTSRAYGTDAVVIPDSGHELMFESSWPTTADVIERWLTDRGL